MDDKKLKYADRLERADKMRRLRSATVQLLFENNIRGPLTKEEIERSAGCFLPDDEIYPDVLHRVEDIVEHREAIEQLIEEHLKKWTISRLDRADLSVLQQAVYELDYCSDIPDKVALNEAVELAKIYGSQESPRFINGILGSLMRDRK